MEKKEAVSKCFARRGKECLLLEDVEIPKYCKACRFKKPERDVTNGKRYEWINTGEQKRPGRQWP